MKPVLYLLLSWVILSNLIWNDPLPTQRFDVDVHPQEQWRETVRQSLSHCPIRRMTQEQAEDFLLSIIHFTSEGDENAKSFYHGAMGLFMLTPAGIAHPFAVLGPYHEQYYDFQFNSDVATCHLANLLSSDIQDYGALTQMYPYLMSPREHRAVLSLSDWRTCGCYQIE